MSINEILGDIQKAISVPKKNTNKFGGYNYRKAEDILEAFKAVAPAGVSLVISDEIVFIGERFYIKATATLYYLEEFKSSHGFAREPLSKKGFDESQITGAASSYARKYALAGLFSIDDTEDADSQDNRNTEQKEKLGKVSNPQDNQIIDQTTKSKLMFFLAHMKISEERKQKLMNIFKVSNLSDLSEKEAISVIKKLGKESPEAEEAWQKYWLKFPDSSVQGVS